MVCSEMFCDLFPCLQMLNLELLVEGRGVKKEDIDNTLSKLRPERRQQFIAECLYVDPAKRPRASHFIKHPVLQEVCVCVCVV